MVSVGEASILRPVSYRVSNNQESKEREGTGT